MRSLRYLFCTVALLCTLPLAGQNFSIHSYPAHGTRLLTADFNRDGHTDLLEYGDLNNLFPATIALNDGKGGFPSSSPVNSLPVAAAAIADLNNDGYPDIATCSLTSPSFTIPQTFAVNIYMNQAGSGAFKLSQSFPLPANTNCVGITAGDMNGDGNTDIVAGVTDGSGLSHVYTYFVNKSGTLSPSIQQTVSVQSPANPEFSCSLAGLAAADYSSTGRYDLVLYGFCSTDVPGAGTFYYAQNAGNGRYNLSEFFEEDGVGLSLEQPLRLVNINNDLLPDLALVTVGFSHPGFGYNTLFLTGQGGGKFSTQDVFDEFDEGDCGNRTAASDVADFNGDGNPDIVNAATVPLTGCGSSIMSGYVLQTGNGQGSWPISQDNNLPVSNPSVLEVNVIAADFNNDNHPDFALVTQDDISGATELLVYMNISDAAVSRCLANGPGAHLCAPIASGSTEQFTATATGITGPVRLMQLYIDGRKVNQFPGNQVNTSVTVAPGTHKAQVVEVEYNGHFSKSAISSFTVKSPQSCVAPATTGVKICSPIAGATAISPVSVTAAAKAATGTTVKAMRVYVDNVAKFTVNGATLSTSLPMAAGNHSIAIVGFEANGATLKTTETIAVH
jgi:hypothetical protein